ncbi:MAG: DUF488 domain-containing protein [Bacteroidetes bacterium]|nr:DUF488 domain-containing protein [Bacteroidota bacterium]MBL7104422.1 DUF488 domain-containing protein [Bacteroidales bacterium]
MFYRKKILLAITELFGGELSTTDFQKLLFIFSVKQTKRRFDFVPYKFGCFSFQASADKKSLIKEGYLENSTGWSLKIGSENFISTLNESDRKQLQQLKLRFSNFTTNELIRYVYLHYPYYAINSEIATKYLSKDELEVIQKFKPKDEKIKLFTIGYEGKSLESYLNILIQKNVNVLCDVRKNPLSRKYGFSKKTLQNACESVNIRYYHLPELGIISEKRRNLNSQSDYDDLFAEYEQSVIPNQQKALKFISDLLNNYCRVALTCFEALPKKCHRTRVANAVHGFDKNIPLLHL